ncbi:TorD/DmsD family molecular chaperone [Shewanella sp. OMA3-2]|uniref:TorD/DmsD family molecular chaperone n=1 Tax=Shewanella sp. OMA3-2 TaxID=2908650 RepID=UPI001F2A6C68|nr:molecular chaperone TorD family protein [Shewanella sp. OMA3-2]UJF22202.1 molecular chaperone TorD family protein [Shewanella sp. OMA3-2]
MTQIERDISENDQLRADIYQLLAALLRRHPNAELLQFLADLDVDAEEGNAMNQAWNALKTVAKSSDVDTLEHEYFSIFLGVGSGEIIPYGSWFMTGSLMDKPLALLRTDLMQMGFERQDNVKEPEDHVAALCEVMGVLILDAPGYRQLAFYQRHIGSWINRFCEALASTPSAKFYIAVAQLAKAFFETEVNEFDQLSLDIPLNCPGSKELEPVTDEVVQVN